MAYEEEEVVDEEEEEELVLDLESLALQLLEQPWKLTAVPGLWQYYTPQ
jgi:hypothetical protein